MMQDGRIRLLLIFLVVSQASCSRYFKQSATVVSTRVKVYFSDHSSEGRENNGTKYLVKVTRYRNNFGYSWENEEILSSEPVPGGLAALEAEMMAKARSESIQEMESNQSID